MKPVVWLVKANEGREMTIRLMEEMDAAAMLRPKSRVMVKLYWFSVNWAKGLRG